MKYYVENSKILIVNKKVGSSMINFIAVDDDKGFLKIIEKVITQAAKEKQIKFTVSQFGEYNEKFTEEMNRPHIGRNIYIFDIETPLANGLEILRMIRKTDKDSIAILISGFEETYTTRIIQDTLNVFTFVSKKDLFKEELMKKVKLAIEYVSGDLYLEFQDSYKKHMLRKDEIIYITAELRTAKIYLANGKVILVKKTLKFLKDHLSKEFVYSHRSCIVNSKLIQSIDKSNRVITFTNGMSTDYVSKNFLKLYSMV